MPQCDNQEAPCLSYKHPEFDHVCQAELVKKLTVKEIANDSGFSTSISLDDIETGKNDCLDNRQYLAGLKNKTGLYQLWVNTEFCIDHNEFLMQGVYVGTQFSECEISKRIKDKWPDADKLYISFYQCEHRIAKYLEQLFLENYSFHLNEAGNTGNKPLFTRWDYERLNFGTELFEEGEAFSLTDGGYL